MRRGSGLFACEEQEVQSGHVKHTEGLGLEPILAALLPMAFYFPNIRVASVCWELFCLVGIHQSTHTGQLSVPHARGGRQAVDMRSKYLVWCGRG